MTGRKLSKYFDNQFTYLVYFEKVTSPGVHVLCEGGLKLIDCSLVLW